MISPPESVRNKVEDNGVREKVGEEITYVENEDAKLSNIRSLRQLQDQ
jgi:hypothetical protein